MVIIIKCLYSYQTFVSFVMFVVSTWFSASSTSTTGFPCCHSNTNSHQGQTCEQLRHGVGLIGVRTLFCRINSSFLLSVRVAFSCVRCMASQFLAPFKYPRNRACRDLGNSGMHSRTSYKLLICVSFEIARGPTHTSVIWHRHSAYSKALRYVIFK